MKNEELYTYEGNHGDTKVKFDGFETFFYLKLLIKKVYIKSK